MLPRMTLDLRSSVTVWALLCSAACSDDGVPADETTAAGETGDAADTTAGASATDPTTQTTSVTATDTSPSTTDDPTNATATASDTGPGNDSSTGDGTGPGETGSGESSGSSDSGSSDATSTGESGDGGAPVGDPCEADGDCSTGICWDFSDYDAFCSGTACSGACDTDEDCTQLILDAGGEYPDESFCGDDGRCWMLGTGFGSYVCQSSDQNRSGGRI